MFHVTSLFGVIFQMNFLNTLTNDCIFSRLSRSRKICRCQRAKVREESRWVIIEKINMLLQELLLLLLYVPFLYSIERWCDYWLWLLLPQCRHYLIKICHIHHHWLSSLLGSPSPITTPQHPHSHSVIENRVRERVLQNHKSFPDEEQKEPDHWWTAITEEGSKLIKKSGMSAYFLIWIVDGPSIMILMLDMIMTRPVLKWNSN